MIREYSSIADLRAEAIRIGACTANKFGDPDWFGHESIADTLQKSATGDQSLVPRAMELISQLEAKIETSNRVWSRSPAGAYAVIPDYLAGLPTPMRRLELETDDSKPINIYVRPNSQASVSAEMLRNRGVAILALVESLTRVRPVNLFYYYVSRGDSGDRGRETVLCARINTAPLDLATACYTLTSAGFYRRMCMGMAIVLNKFDGGRVIPDSQGEEICWQELGQDPARTLVIGTAQSSDPILTDPVKWVQAQVNRFTKEEANAR